MASTTEHIIDLPWDAPFDRIRIAYSFTPGRAASWDDPGEPDKIVPLLCRAQVGGAWEDQSECVLQVMTEILRDDMIAKSREERAQQHAYARTEVLEDA